MDEFAAMAPAQQQQQQQNDRSLFASSSASSSPADMHRPRRHLPSPALAQATSLLRLTQTYGSFDISELSGLHLSLTSSPSAPVVSSSAGLMAGRKLPVPGRTLANHHKMSSSGHFSQSDLMMAGVADAMDEMDALIRPASGSASLSSVVVGVGGSASASGSVGGSVRDSPKLSLSRKLPVPPVSVAAKVMNQSRRLLPRPLSCDVPCVSDADLSSALQPSSGYLSSQSQRASSSLLCRPYSFDYSGAEVELELEEAAVLQHQLQHGSACSDPSLVYQESGVGGVYPGRRSLMRQSSTTSCPALVRPCALSPRSPKYRTMPDALSFNGSVSGGSSINTTPSPLPLLHPSLSTLSALSAGTTMTTTDPAAYVPTGILVPFTTPSQQHNNTALPCSSALVGSVATASASGIAAGIIVPPRPYLMAHETVPSSSSSSCSVTIPSAGSAFRAPPLSQQHRQASLSLPPNGPGCPSSLDAASALAALRRHRYHDAGDGSGSLCGSLHMNSNEFSHYRLDMQRPSRSRQPVRNSAVLAAR